MLLRFIIVLFTCLSFSSLSWANIAETSSYPPLQPLVDKLKRGDVFIIPPGTYSGPVLLNRRLHWMARTK